MPEPFVSAVPKLLDVVNVPVAYSFDYACQLITIPAGQTRGATRDGCPNTRRIIGTTYRANKLALAQDINSTGALSPVIEILPH